MYRPPAPMPLPPARALFRTILRGGRDLLSLIPNRAYTMRVGRMGVTRRSIILVNDPDLVREVMGDRVEDFPKNDLFTGALAPLVGEGIFTSTGEVWRSQRRMIEPAFTRMHVGRAFSKMSESIDDIERELDASANSGQPFALDAAMSRLTADIISRAIFSTTLDSRAAQDIFRAFADYQDLVANVEIKHLLFKRAWSPIRQPQTVIDACESIRARLRDLLLPRLGGEGPVEDIAADLVAARDAETGEAFTLDELVDQIGVFFLAGHETTATAVTWALFILSQQPEVAARARAEVEAVAGPGPITLDACKRLSFVRAVFREAMRLYPPLSFLPRVAVEACRIGPQRVPKGAMVMISPWILHRHPGLWPDPDVFEPERFLPEREGEIPAGAYLPFGLGPRLCVGVGFATIEGVLILARLLRRYRVEAVDPGSVRPAVRLTTRPERAVMMRAHLMAGARMPAPVRAAS